MKRISDDALVLDLATRVFALNPLSPTDAPLVRVLKDWFNLVFDAGRSPAWVREVLVNFIEACRHKAGRETWGVAMHRWGLASSVAGEWSALRKPPEPLVCPHCHGLVDKKHRVHWKKQ
jgi:hypothetical protein